MSSYFYRITPLVEDTLDEETGEPTFRADYDHMKESKLYLSAAEAKSEGIRALKEKHGRYLLEVEHITKHGDLDEIGPL